MIVLKNAKARTAIRFIVPLALFPAVAAASAIAGGRAYVAGASVCALLAVLVFLAGFEQKKIGSRRLPLFKPVTALTMIAGIYLGRESGFAAGAFSALISDFYFGFGPWTPFQMLTWGLIGYIAGALGEKLKNSTPRQIVFGVISGLMFSALMDVWATLDFTGGFTAQTYLAALVNSLPFTALYAVSNAVFILLMSRPFGEKLTRIKIKYGI